MAKRIIFICDECLSRNYKPSVSSNTDKRFEINKYNILPLPPLDGFKIVSSIIEKTTKKNIPEKFDLFF